MRKTRPSAESCKVVVQGRPLTSGRFGVPKMGAQKLKVDCRPSTFEPPFWGPQNGRSPAAIFLHKSIHAAFQAELRFVKNEARK